MKKILALSFMFTLVSNIFCQNIVLDSLHTFSNELFENSGLIFFNNKLITHTDSGGENALFEIDTNDATVQRKVYLKDLINIDWEDVAQDDDNIYLADFGNNQGNRTNLKIHIIDKLDFETTPNDTVQTQEINFFYEDQTDFTIANQNTNFDAEALIVFEDSLYIFTKNWINQETNVYVLAKTAGTDTARFIFSYDVEGLVTGAEYDKELNKMFLCGYTKFASPFIFEMDSFNANNFFNGINTRHSIDIIGSTQIEGICIGNNRKLYVGSEKFLTAESILHSFIDSVFLTEIDTIPINDTILFIQEKEIIEEILYPNPVQNLITFSTKVKEIEVFNLSGKMIKKSMLNKVNVSNLENGIYFLKVNNLDKSFKIFKFRK